MARISGTVRLASRMIEDDLDDYEILDVSIHSVCSKACIRACCQSFQHFSNVSAAAQALLYDVARSSSFAVPCFCSVRQSLFECSLACQKWLHGLCYRSCLASNLTERIQCMMLFVT
jgi:hypothetical protein